MKHLNEYIEEKTFEYEINEGLLKGINKFFKKIFNNTSKIKEKLKIDINQLKRSKHPIDFNNLQNNEFTSITSDKSIGFPILNEFVKNNKKYIGDDPSVAKTFLHFSIINKKPMQCGALMFNENPELRKGEAVQLLCIDTSLAVANEADINKTMIDLWLNDLSTKKDIQYIFCKPTHPKLKGIITSVGFSQDKGNKEIYIRNIK